MANLVWAGADDATLEGVIAAVQEREDFLQSEKARVAASQPFSPVGKPHLRLVSPGQGPRELRREREFTSAPSVVTKDGAEVEHYEYDANGNRTLGRVDGIESIATYDDQDRLLTYGEDSFTYNKEGQLTSKTTPTGTTTYEYDELGNLLGVTLEDGTRVEYEVDGQGRRVSKKTNGSPVVNWLYGMGTQPIAELDNNAGLVSEFGHIAESTAAHWMSRNGTFHRILTDERGSTRLVLNSSGTVKQSVAYSAFGVIIGDSSPNFQPFYYSAGLGQADVGLVRFGAREYDPLTGRFSTFDPIDFAGGDTNLYAFVGEDPINFIDPTGLIRDKISGVAGPGGSSSQTGTQSVPGSGPRWNPYSGEAIAIMTRARGCPLDAIAMARPVYPPVGTQHLFFVLNKPIRPGSPFGSGARPPGGKPAAVAAVTLLFCISVPTACDDSEPGKSGPYIPPQPTHPPNDGPVYGPRK